MSTTTILPVPFFTTENERLTYEKERLQSVLKEEYKFLHTPNPTYIFNVGDEVEYGNYISCKVEEIYNEGKHYLLLCLTSTSNNGYHHKYYSYRVACWHEIRPITPIYQELSKLKPKHGPYSFMTSNISGLINRYYNEGIDINSKFQPELIWNKEDKEKLIESIFNCIHLGRFVFVDLYFNHEKGVRYEILDGKQRLSTIIEFYENKFAYKGKYYNELSQIDRSEFLSAKLEYANIPNLDENTLRSLFLMFNRKGRTMSNEQFKKIETQLVESK